MKSIHTVAFILLIVGGLNWGLEVFGWGIGSFLSMGVANVVYILVALAALFEVFTHKDSCKHCESKPGQMMQGM
jgi:uncharacterized membrane protein YuzA (DUF378 family)